MKRHATPDASSDRGNRGKRVRGGRGGRGGRGRGSLAGIPRAPVTPLSSPAGAARGTPGTPGSSAAHPPSVPVSPGHRSRPSVHAPTPRLEPAEDGIEPALGAGVTGDGDGTSPARLRVSESGAQPHVPGDEARASNGSGRMSRTLEYGAGDVGDARSNLDAKCRSQEVQLAVLTDAVGAAQSSLKKTEERNKALHQTVDELVTKNQELSGRGTRNTSKKLMDSIPKEFLGIALAVEKRLTDYAVDETRELVPFKRPMTRNWRGRGEISSGHGVVVLGGQRLVPTSPFRVAARGTYFTPSVESEVEVLEFIVNEELKGGTWGAIFPDEEACKDVRTVLGACGAMKSKLKQVLSDTSSGRKRAARDSFFVSYGYHRLHSRHSSNAADETRLRDEEMELVKSKVVKSSDQGNITNFSFWRTQPEATLSKDGAGTVGTSAEDLPFTGTLSAPVNEEENPHQDEEGDENLCMFASNKSIGVYHLFVGFRPKMAGELYETSILSLARLDAWINVVIETLDPAQGRGGKRQKLEDRKRAVLDMEREATVVVQTTSPSEWFVAVKCSWFKQYVTEEMGDVHDCYIGKISNDFSVIDLLGDPYQDN